MDESGNGNEAIYTHVPLRAGEIWIIERILESTGLLNPSVIVEDIPMSVEPDAGVIVCTRKYGSGVKFKTNGAFRRLPLTSMAEGSTRRVYVWPNFQRKRNDRPRASITPRLNDSVLAVETV